MPETSEFSPQPESPEHQAQRSFIEASDRLTRLKSEYALRHSNTQSDGDTQILDPSTRETNGYDTFLRMAEDRERKNAIKYAKADIASRQPGLVEVRRAVGPHVFARYSLRVEGEAVMERLEEVGVSLYVDEGDRVIVVNSRNAEQYQMPQTERNLSLSELQTLNAKLEDLVQLLKPELGN